MSREACRRIWFPLASSVLLIVSMGLGTAAATGNAVFGLLILLGAVCLWLCGALWAGAVIDLGERAKPEGSRR